MIGIMIKHDDSVTIATTSYDYTQPSCCYVDSNMPCWRPNQNKDAIMACISDNRVVNSVRYQGPLFDFKKMGDVITSHNLARIVLPRLISNLEKGNILIKDKAHKELFGNFLFAKGDKAFNIDGYMNIMEIETYEAFGDHKDKANMMLDALKDIKDKTYIILKICLSIIGYSNAGIFPVIIRNTKDFEVHPYSLEEAVLYVHNFEKGGK